MLPQTNLQLYRVLIDRGCDDASLALVRAAYDLTLALFGNSIRPSQKLFVAHLVGTAGALVRWDQRVEVVAAGMLHSAYLYGDFRDGRRGAHAARRSQVRAILGADAESLIAAYTAADWRRPVRELSDAVAASTEGRELTTIKLADTWDEVCDGGPHYAPAKSLGFGAVLGEPAPAALLDLARRTVSAAAANDLEREFARTAAFVAPAVLVSGERASRGIHDTRDLLGPSTLAQRLAAKVRRLTG